jgi:hypothetical protein
MIKRKKIIFFSMLIISGMILLQPITANTETTKKIAVIYEPPTDPWLSAGNGERINITAGNRSQIRTQEGNQIRIRVNESVQLRINESETNPVGPLLNGTRAVNTYMHIHLNGTVTMNATMFRNYTNHELSGLGNVSTFRWAWFNTAENQWQYAVHNWVEITPNGATVFCNTTHFSIWTILAEINEAIDNNPTPGTPFNAQNSSSFAVKAGNNYQIKTQYGFSIQLKLSKGANVTITEFETPAHQMTRARHQIRTQTMSIELNDSSIQIQANFSFTFTNQIKNQLGVKNMNNLKFMFYNESSSEWEVPKHQWIEGDTLNCNSTHFSLWTVTEEEDVEATPGFELIPFFLALLSLFMIRNKRKMG